MITSRSFPLSYLPNHTEPVQAKDLLDSLIVVTQLLHRDGNLRIIADVFNFARQFRAAIKIRAQGDVVFADKLYAVVDHLCELVHMHPVFIGDGAAKIQGNRLCQLLVYILNVCVVTCELKILGVLAEEQAAT